ADIPRHLCNRGNFYFGDDCCTESSLRREISRRSPRGPSGFGWRRNDHIADPIEFLGDRIEVYRWCIYDHSWQLNTTFVHMSNSAKPIIVVSGLPRSGTSLMMRMLHQGGLEPVTDGIRQSDEDNPRGYFEVEQVKGLKKQADKSWLGIAQGKAI